MTDAEARQREKSRRFLFRYGWPIVGANGTARRLVETQDAWTQRVVAEYLEKIKKEEGR